MLNPVRQVVIYLIITFLIFLLSEVAWSSDSIYLVIPLVLAFIFSFYFGSNLVFKYSRAKRKELPIQQGKIIKAILFFGSIYFMAWGVNQVVDFGARNPLDIVDNLLNSGQAYKAKFDTFEAREFNQQTNNVTRILLLFSFFYASFIPLLVIYWSLLSRFFRLWCVLSLIIYVISFLYIGTQKGIGDVVIMAISGMWIRLVVDSKSRERLKLERLKVILCAIFITVLLISMQASRSLVFDRTETVLFGDVKQSLIADAVGVRYAFGIYNLLGYPSHGYIGLMHNLSLPYVFSYGAGLSPALESYLVQYGFKDPSTYLTYPHRTEIATGWSASLVWSTAFSWFASDLSFWGVIPFMFCFGAFFTFIWLRSYSTLNVIEIALLGQLSIMAFFLPANNQLLMSRQGFISLMTLIILLIGRNILRKI